MCLIRQCADVGSRQRAMRAPKWKGTSSSGGVFDSGNIRRTRRDWRVLVRSFFASVGCSSMSRKPHRRAHEPMVGATEKRTKLPTTITASLAQLLHLETSSSSSTHRR